MTKIKWSEDCSVGVPSIDEQHKQLVSLTNELFQAIIKDQGQDVALDVLNQVAEFAKYHIDHEESLLQKYDYPRHRLQPHIAEHRKLIHGVDKLIRESSTDHLDLKIYDFLRTWTTEHFNLLDKDFATFLQDKGAK